MSEDIFFKGKRVGIYNRESFTYITERDGSHFFCKYQGFGLSFSVMEELKKKGCLIVALIYTKADGSKVVHKTPLIDFYEKGIIWKDVDNDYQRILPLKEWRSEKKQVQVTIGEI